MKRGEGGKRVKGSNESTVNDDKDDNGFGENKTRSGGGGTLTQIQPTQSALGNCRIDETKHAYTLAYTNMWTVSMKMLK